MSSPHQASVKIYGAKSDGSPLLAGVITAILLAVLWTLLVYVTHHPVGLAAWGVGGLVGVAVAKFAREPGPSRGMLAAVLTVASTLLAKVLILAFALGPILRDEILRSPETTATVFLVDMTAHRSFSPELQAALDRQPHARADTTLADLGGDLTYRMIAEAEARAAAAGPAERERVVRMHTSNLFAREGFVPLLARLFGLFDMLWLGLGVSSAWKLAQT